MTLIVGGIDAGSYSVKVVLLAGDALLARQAVVAGSRSEAEAAASALDDAAAAAGISIENIGRLVATGSGRSLVPFADDTALEVMCAARGVDYYNQDIRNVMDVGAEHCVAVQCLDGQPLNVARTDACAAGAGIFLQVVSSLLEMPLEAMGPVALHSGEVAEVVSRCAVFAESDIISLIHSGTSTEAILRGVYQGLAMRLYPLFVQVGIRGAVAMIGGGAEDVGLVAFMEERLGVPVFIPPYPSSVAALGAALIARDGLGSPDIGGESGVIATDDHDDPQRPAAPSASEHRGRTVDFVVPVRPESRPRPCLL